MEFLQIGANWQHDRVIRMFIGTNQMMAHLTAGAEAPAHVGVSESICLGQHENAARDGIAKAASTVERLS